MAVVYRNEKLRRIHKTRSAIDGQLYQGEDNVLYIGNAEGFLERSKDLIGDVNTKSLNNKDTAIDGRPVTATNGQGQILVDSGMAIVPLLPGANGTVLTADSNTPSGVKWATPITQGVSWTAGRNKKATNIYIEINNIFTNIVPITTAEDIVIESILAESNTVSTWTAEIHDNLVPITDAFVNVLSSLSASAIDLNIQIPAGTRLMFYVNGEDIIQPRITIICTK